MFERYFSSGTGNKNCVFDVKVFSLNDDKSKLLVNIALKNEELYCCGEITCHFKADWNRIRSIAKESGVELAKPLTIKFNVTVEDGALLETNKSIGAPMVSKKYEYTEELHE